MLRDSQQYREIRDAGFRNEIQKSLEKVTIDAMNHMNEQSAKRVIVAG